MSVTIKNLESALAGESMAHIKYRYFAKIARAEGYEDVALHFEKTADQEVQHAFGHLAQLVGDINTHECLVRAIEGETYEYTEMYPQFAAIASRENNMEVAKLANEQALESKAHAEAFAAVLKKAEKRFAALKKIEEKHAHEFRHKLEDNFISVQETQQ